MTSGMLLLLEFQSQGMGSDDSRPDFFNKFYIMIFDCLNNITIPHLIDTLRYSGRGLNHVGKYDSCIAATGMDYKLVTLAQDPNSPAGIASGLCLPTQCTAKEVEIGITTLLQKLQVPLYVKSVQDHFPEYQYPYTFWFFVAVFVLIAFATLFFMASCSKQLQRHHLLSAFSFKNSMKIFKYHVNDLNVLNGIRALSMLWVIFGHEYSLDISMAENVTTVEKYQMGKPIFLIALSGLFSVDTFFFIGGFLAAYVVLKQPSTSLLKYPLAILNRYLRIVPAYFVAILIYYGLYMHLGSGPFWPANVPQVQMCATLWKPLLFVDNLVDNARTMCMGWGWYLQNDMQMFCYCMLILLIYQQKRMGGFLMIYLSMAASFAFTMQQTYDHKYKNLTHFSDFDTVVQYQLDVYYKPWARCPPYLYGLFLGILYYQFLQYQKNPYNVEPNLLVDFKNRFQRKTIFRVCFEIVGILLGCFVCFIPRTAQGLTHYWPQLAHSLYLTYGKTFFVFSLSLIILPSLLGIKTFVRLIMDTNFFNVIAKISFCTYLIHLTLLMHWFTTRGIDGYWSFTPKYFLFISHTVGSLFLGFLMTLLVQIPCSRLQKTLISKLFGKLQKKNKDYPKKQSEGEQEKVIEKQEIRLINPSILEQLNEKEHEIIDKKRELKLSEE